MKQKIIELKTSELIPYAGNSRTHDENQIAQIAASIKEFGFTNPILIDDENGIIAGHGRLLAAQKLKIETVPCMRLDHLTDAQRRAYVIADNKLALNAGWDEKVLAAEIERLLEDDFDLAAIGFDEKEINKMLSSEEDVSEPSIEEVIEVIVECENEQRQKEAYDFLTQKGFKCRLSTL